MGFLKQTIRDVHVEHSTIIMRADYNVPLNKEGGIRDDLRIRASLPTLKYLLEKDCKVVIIAHLGRPDGTGVGLFLAKKVIDAHGGKVIFESVENKGSTFGFSLPVSTP